MKIYEVCVGPASVTREHLIISGRSMTEAIKKANSRIKRDKDVWGENHECRSITLLGELTEESE